MDCQKAAKLIPLFLDDQLKADESQLINEHLASCVRCQKELELYQESWDMLSHWKDLEPEPGYVSRFWTRLSLEASWLEKLRLSIRETFVQRKLAAIVTTALILIIVGFLSSRILPIGNTEKELAKLNSDEIELVDHLELAQHFDVIENMDTIEDLDIVENLDSLES